MTGQCLFLLGLALCMRVHLSERSSFAPRGTQAVEADSQTQISALPYGQEPEAVEVEKLRKQRMWKQKYERKNRFEVAGEQKQSFSELLDGTTVQNELSGVCCSDVYDEMSVAELDKMMGQGLLRQKPHHEMTLGLSESEKRDASYMAQQRMFSFSAKSNQLCGPIPRLCCPESTKEAVASDELELCLVEMAHDPTWPRVAGIHDFLHLPGRQLMWNWRSPRASLERIFEAS